MQKVLVSFSAKKPEYIKLISNVSECLAEKRNLDIVEEHMIVLKHLEDQI